MSQQRVPETAILPSKITIELSELSSKQRKSILGLIKDMGFVPGEIREVAVLVQGPGVGTEGMEAPVGADEESPALEDGK